MMTTTTMMMEINGNDQRLYYLPCNFCTTILAVSVPSCTNQLVNNMVTIRCGRCSNMQTVNMGAMLPAAFLAAAASGAATINPPPHLQQQQQQQSNCTNSQLPDQEYYMYSFQAAVGTGGSSSSSSKLGGGQLSKTLISTSTASNKQKNPLQADHDQRGNGLMLPTNPPPEKRQRAPSAYNRFIKEEIRRIKLCNPDISHKEAFSMAAKNWAHFPHIQFGLALDATKQANLDASLVGGDPAMAHSYP